MKRPSENELNRIRREYPVGTIIELLEMPDTQAPPVGTLGEVTGVDDAGDLLMRWATGSRLKIIISEDRFRKVDGVITVCYGKREYWISRAEAIRFFLQGVAATEGSERDRYSQIYAELVSGRAVCTDETD